MLLPLGGRCEGVEVLLEPQVLAGRGGHGYTTGQGSGQRYKRQRRNGGKGGCYIPNPMKFNKPESSRALFTSIYIRIYCSTWLYAPMDHCPGCMHGWGHYIYYISMIVLYLMTHILMRCAKPLLDKCNNLA